MLASAWTTHKASRCSRHRPALGVHQTAPRGLAASAVRGIWAGGEALKVRNRVTPCSYDDAVMSNARFRRCAGGVTSLGLPVVWCLKYRRRVLGGRVARRLDELLGEVAAEHCWEIVASEVMPDHVHIFVRVGPTGSAGAVARLFNGRTSRVLRAEFAWLARLRGLWSTSHFAASVGYVSESTVRRYIEQQWDHVA